jgi:tetratricopeptide (TPR) repeat protein
LIGQAEEALEEGDTETALRVGKQLIEARHTFGFEAVARAHHADGDDEQAFATLEQGVKEAPHVWTLWHLLGNYASDAEDYPRAFECYERALACDRVEADVVHLNYAADLHNAGRDDEVLARLALVKDPEYTTPVAVVAADALNALGRHQQALDGARQAIAAAPNDAENADLARLYCAIAEALRQRDDREGALAACWKAIAYDHDSERAMALIREVEAQYSGKARYFRLLIQGRGPNPEEGDAADQGFLMKCDVVADTPEEALRLIARFEPAEMRASLTIEETESVRSAEADQPKGVYWFSGRAFYQEDKG